MFSSLLKFEFSYQLTRRVSWLFVIVFFIIGYLFGGQSFVPDNISYNAPYEISSKMGLLSLGAVFAIMFFCINGVLRDRQYKTESILYTTKINKFQFFGIRLIGVLIVSLLVFTFSMIGFFAGVSTSPLDPLRVLPFDFIHYAWVWLVFVLPNIFICVSILFSVSILSKNAVTTYAAAIFIYAFYWVCSIFFDSPLLATSTVSSGGNMIIAALMDPFGLSAFFEQTQFWTSTQKNTQLVSFSGYFLWNRVLWVFTSSIILLLNYKAFSFRKLNKRLKKASSKKKESTSAKKEYTRVKTLHFDFKSDYKRLLSLLKIEFKTVFKSLPFLAIMLVWIIIVFTEIITRVNFGSGNYNESLYPTTNLIIWLIKDPLPVLGFILIVLYSGEMVWRSHSLNFHKILDVTPANNIAFYLSQLITLILLPLILIVTSIIIGIIIQITKGYYVFEIGQYLDLFYYSGTSFIFYAVFALFVQSIVHNKYLGMLITGALMILFNSPLMQKMGIHHPLFYVGNLPNVAYTNMTGYGDYARPFHYYALHWSVLAVILALVVFKIWRRGDSKSLKSRLEKFNFKKDKRYLISFLVLFNMLIISTSYIYYNTSVVTDFVTPVENLNLREAYERKYKSYNDIRKLVPVDIKTKVDIFPEEGKYIIKGDYILKNKSKDSVTELLVSDRISIHKIELEKAILMEYDSVLNTRLYKFKTAILPNEKLKFNYEVIYQKKGFETSTILVDNGTFILHNFFEPSLGYRNGFEIQNQFERTRRGLPDRTDERLSSGHFHSDNVQYEKIPFETVVSTQADQIAIAPGNLIREWKNENRNYYHYKIQHKVIPQLGYFSGKYETKKETFKGINIEQYYLSDHYYNIDNISASIKKALDYCQTEFGKYQFDHIRLLEIPSYWNFGGMAQPGTIAMVENNLYLIDGRDPRKFDLVAKRTIHEVAHQWIGHQLTPKNTSGSGVITEGLTKYVEIVLMEKLYGRKAVWQLTQTSNGQYFKGRAFETGNEPTLETEQGKAYVLYGKSTNIMLALKELIGEEKMNLVIRNLLDKYKNDIEPGVTILDFLNELFLVSPEEYHSFISDWFKKRVIYNLKIKESSYEKLENGKYKVTIDIDAARFDTEESGELIELSIDEPIQIGIFSIHPSLMDAKEKSIYLKPHQINKKKNLIVLELDEKPSYISIDPFGSRLDKNLADNILKL